VAETSFHSIPSTLSLPSQLKLHDL